MHELSICEAIATVVLEHAGGRRVESVQVRLGALRQVVPEALTFCWDIVSRQPQLGGARLEIECVDGVIQCGQCGTRSTLREFILCCPACGSVVVTVVAGEEFLVTSIDLTADDASADPVRE